MPFGKHKGTPLNQLPTDYVDWLKTTDLKDPLKGHFNDFVNSGNTGTTTVGTIMTNTTTNPSPRSQHNETT